MTGLYRNFGLEIYEKSHYSHGEQITEVEQVLSWYRPGNGRILDIGCSGGLHAVEFAKKGFSVTGMDIEPSAIELAKKRNASNKQKIDFMIIDIEKDEISGSGKFDLVYSIGNVLSHLRKDNLINVLRKIRGCIDDNGIFLFDVLINSRPFLEEILPDKDDNQIIWIRKIDEKTGMIIMDGTFPDFGFKQHFEVWGYTIEEIRGLLKTAGFKEIGFSEKLDFKTKNKTKNPLSLYFRAKG